MDKELLKKIIEGALLASTQPMNINSLLALFPEDVFAEDLRADKAEIQAALEDLQADCAGHGYELREVGSGWRFQVRQELAPWVNRLWEEKPARYSRALLETLALIAYRQPITRGDVEDVRGVAVSTNIIQTLMERNWVRVVGHRDVPGRPALYATTREFLDYFNLKSLDQLPSLSEIHDIETLNRELNFEGLVDAAVEQKLTDAGVGSDASDIAAHAAPPDSSADNGGDDAPTVH